MVFELVMDVENADDNGKLILWPAKDSDNDNQKWTFDPDFSIRNGLGTVLDVEGGSTDNGAKIGGYAKHGGDNQKFRVVPVNDD
ncbi:hypothetical protein C0J52_19716 [Blattella germanica]|nr:hypothetical protein C0J52_19716 [Blattella germanica]